MNPYELKQEQRRERLEQAAARARAESNAASQRVTRTLDAIPPGQPILVGHHSEKRHRRDLGRADDAMRRSVEKDKQARELAARAAAVGTGGISSDDPNAAEKLTDKRTELEQRRDWMKSANAFWKKHGTLDGWDGPAEIATDGLTTLRVCPYERQPFPSYALTNIGARIRDAAKRAERIASTATLVQSGQLTQTERTVNGYRIVDDPEENRVNLIAPARLSRDDYKTVRSYGFLWSPTRNAFTRKRTGPGVVAIAESCARLLTPT